MSSPLSPCSDTLRPYAEQLGISAVGIAKAVPVSPEASRRYQDWIDEGCHAGMKYLERYGDIRNDPRLLIEGAKSIVVAAFNYYPPVLRDSSMPEFALYSYGKDYHEVVRDRLNALAAIIRELFGGETRVCVDTAPIRERYWAREAGIGFIGRNNQLIIPGKGSYFFLGEIITTAELSPDEPCMESCGDCKACVRRCPGQAIRDDGTVDANKCLSYLTIEHKGDFMGDISLGNHIYGCDECLAACPHNLCADPTDIAEFMPSDEFLLLERDRLENMTQEEFNAVFRHSAVKRAKLSGLMRNLRRLR